MSIGIGILLISLLVFTILIIWFITAGQNIDWPNDVHKIVKKYDDNIVYIMRTDDLDPPDKVLVSRSVAALRATIKSWTEVIGSRGLEGLEEVAILFESEDKWNKGNFNGLQVHLSAPIGGISIPLLLIRNEFEPNENKDPLIIHEAIHVLASEIKLTKEQNHGHKDKRLWGQSKEGSVEFLAQKYYKEMIS